MFWKTSYAEENFKSSRFLQRKDEKNIGKDFRRNKENRGVKPAKKNKIIEIYVHIWRKEIDIFETNSKQWSVCWFINKRDEAEYN